MGGKSKDGYRSGLEREVGAFLRREGISHKYEGRVIPYTQRVRSGFCSKCGAKEVHKHRRYTPDFTFPRKKWAVEVKGRLTSADRGKLRAVRACGNEIRMIFRVDNRVAKKGIRYSEWCKKHRFKYTFIQTMTRGFFDAD